MLSTDLTIIAEYLGWVAGIGGSIIAIYKFGKFFHKKLIKPILDFFRAVDDSINILSKMDYEFTSNGGKSIKDAINRIELRQISQEHRIRAILSHWPLAFFESDSSGACVWVNKTYSRLTGKSIEELRGNGWLNVIAEEDREKVSKEWFSSIDQQREFSLKYRIITDTGKIIPVICHSFLVYDKNNKSSGSIGCLEIIYDKDTVDVVD